MMYAIYVQRLMSSTLPDPPVRPGMFVSAGPAGKCSSCSLPWHFMVDEKH